MPTWPPSQDRWVPPAGLALGCLVSALPHGLLLVCLSVPVTNQQGRWENVLRVCASLASVLQGVGDVRAWWGLASGSLLLPPPPQIS